MAEPESLASDAASPPAPPPEESLSLQDHERLYGEGAQQTQAEPREAPAELPAAGEPDAADEGTPETEDAAGPRDEKGRFLPKTRHRAASQQATPEDSPRIRELTRKWREAEAERDQLRAQSVPRGTPAPPPAPIAEKPKPVFDEYLARENDYSAALAKFTDDLTDWKTDQKLAAWENKRQEQERQRAAEVDRQRLTKSWTERVTAAKTRYPDFESVALQSDTAIPQGSLIDAWILEHKSGADVLYYLQSHPEEVTTLLGQSVLEQAESLALLSQRLNGHSTRRPDAATGSSATVAPIIQPKPPNPVRTGPLQTGNEPPDPDKASLIDHERYWSHQRSRRA